jgi:hypothetical protein
MPRLAVLLIATLTAAAGCHKPPVESEREWKQALLATLPDGWVVLVVTGDPEKNKFVGWFEAPGPDGKTCRVEVHVRPREEDPEEREWAVSVHQPDPRSKIASVSFAAADDGAGPLEVTRDPGDPAAVEAARPLAEEAVRQVRGLKLF